jgi:hypothetical protein
MMERLFGETGTHWATLHYQDSGRFCLVGALRRIRATRGVSNRAGVFLSRAIAKTVGGRMGIMEFNDSRKSYAEIHEVIVLARELARKVVESHVTQQKPPCSAAVEPERGDRQMPFDGAFFPESPEAKPTIVRRAAALFRGKPKQYAWEPVPKRITQARQAVIALAELEVLLGHGSNWVQKKYHDGGGGHCLVGGLQVIREKHRITSDADAYLRDAIRRMNYSPSGPKGIERFNDSRQSYAEIKAVIVLAKQSAQQVVDQYYGRGMVNAGSA